MLFKSHAIPLAGYLYQNLIGLEILCDWLEDPSLYSWVSFEADSEEATPALDDVVAANADDSARLLLQVKFTVDPHNDDYSLNWDWLLAKKPRGKSLIQKWADGLDNLGSGKIVETALVTNRLPDKTFNESLGDGLHVDLSLVASETLNLILKQLGGSERAHLFFKQFGFRHSHQHFLSLEQRLVTRLIPAHATRHGWLELRHRALIWALQRNTPPPDGRITLDTLRNILASTRPEPISQTFRIPVGYNPPNDDFHRSFSARLLERHHHLTILWGSPGQGKSTFLSYICRTLEEAATPYVRHHYFLNLTDISDRLSFPSVANSLMAQIESHHSAHVAGLSTSPEKLREWLTRCGAGYAALGRRFIVIIDGLDHVWRESSGSRDMLDALFKHLLPVPDNVALVLGTQKVAPHHLPQRLGAFATEDMWLELPRMTVAAIRGWLERHEESGRITLSKAATPRANNTIDELAQAFFDISRGHPLHLTYSLETLTQLHGHLDAHDVRALVGCPDGDIRTYYAALWNSLSPKGKHALHAVACTDFIWPELGLDYCLGLDPGTVSREIGHLFYLSEAGPVPFHGSVLAFTRERADHSAMVSHLSPLIAAWLRDLAPPYHRWGWLWLFKARSGDQADLITLPTRDWIITSVANGYPISQIVKILEAAERLTFFAHDFVNAIRFRWLKVRLHNGSEFQLPNFQRLRACAVRLSSDDYLTRSLSATFDIASTDELSWLGDEYVRAGRFDDAIDCQEELRARINYGLGTGTLSRDRLSSMCEAHLTLAASIGRYKPGRVIESILGLGALSTPLFTHFLIELGKKRDPSLLLDLAPYPMTLAMRRELECVTVRIASLCRIALHEWTAFARFKKHPISACWALLYRAPIATVQYNFDTSIFDTANRDHTTDSPLERYLHFLFFETLRASLELHGAPQPLHGPVFAHRSWLSYAALELVKSANGVGGLLSRGDQLQFGICFQMLSGLRRPLAFEERSDYRVFCHALIEVSNDLFAILSRRQGRRHIDSADWSSASRSPHFFFHTWQSRYVRGSLHLLHTDVVRTVVLERETKEDSVISQFNERAEVFLGLCELAMSEGLDEDAHRLLSKATSCVMSYGWRKDVTIFHVLSALDTLSEYRPNASLQWLNLLSPAIAVIDKITDGDETNHSKSEMAELYYKLDPRSYVAYYNHLVLRSEWLDAERVFSIFAERGPLQSEVARACLSCVWSALEVGPLRKRTGQEALIAAYVVSKNETYFGFRSGELGRERDRSISSEPTRDAPPFDSTSFSPSDLTALIAALRGASTYIGDRAAVEHWFDHWVSRGCWREVLKSLGAALKEEAVPSEVEGLLDNAFALSLRLQGREAAYKWIVAAHIHKHGWSDFWSKKDAIDRIKTVATLYADRWKQFVTDTSQSPFAHSEEQLVIPHHRLIQLLVLVGEVDYAALMTEEMVSTVLLETSGQPITRPSWMEG